MRSLRRRQLALVSIALVAPSHGCGSSGSRTAPRPDAAPAAAVDEAPAPPPPPAPPPFADDIKSLRLRRSISVRVEPSDQARRIGTVAQDTRVGWRSAATGPGCKQRWIEIQPHGWVCEVYLEPSTQPPAGIELPRLPRAELMPGVYGKVHAAGATTWIENPALKPPPPPPKAKGKPKKGKDKPAVATEAPKPAPVDTSKLPRLVKGTAVATSAHVRRWEELEIAGKTYWRIAAGDKIYVQRKDINLHTPSAYHGERLGDDAPLALPVAIAKVALATHPTADAKPRDPVTRKLAARTVLNVLEVARDAAGAATAYRVADAEWVSARDAILVESIAPPPGLRERERWIDIDLDQQVLVAYEGDLPVYVTMVSTGGKTTPTETGLYRTWMKFAETDMNGLAAEGSDETYEVSTVPWTQYFFKDLALHTAYWHDRFGTPRSHGCVNLSPTDARYLYFWSDPQVPPGWTMVTGHPGNPGSLIRIRNAADPTPTILREMGTGSPSQAPETASLSGGTAQPPGNL